TFGAAAPFVTHGEMQLGRLAPRAALASCQHDAHVAEGGRDDLEHCGSSGVVRLAELDRARTRREAIVRVQPAAHELGVDEGSPHDAAREVECTLESDLVHE